MNLTNVNEAPGIDYKMFRNGFFFIVFNLSPDLEITNPASPDITGNAELEMSWAEALPVPINMIIYSTYNSALQLTNTKDVVLT